jgi:phage-related protein
MPAALPLTDMISQASTGTYKNKVRIAQFGDGYVQAVADGLNSTMGMWQLTYENLSSSERSTLKAVLDAVGSWDYVTWQSPLDASSKKWLVTEDGIAWTAKSGDLYTATFTLRQIP